MSTNKIGSKRKIVVLSGAGVSAESGINTFRAADGLWEGHSVTEVASPEGWFKNKELVLDFYNQRRRQLHEVKPNRAHELIAKLEINYDVVVVTQNVDDLHERGGSSSVIHLHGELLKSKSSEAPYSIYPCYGDIKLGDKCEHGSQLRPFIVWFGESVPLLEDAAREVATADIIIVVGTSMQVYPAASLVEFAPSDVEVFYIDPKPSINHSLASLKNLSLIKETATIGMETLYQELA